MTADYAYCADGSKVASENNKMSALLKRLQVAMSKKQLTLSTTLFTEFWEESDVKFYNESFEELRKRCEKNFFNKVICKVLHNIYKEHEKALYEAYKNHNEIEFFYRMRLMMQHSHWTETLNEFPSGLKKKCLRLLRTQSNNFAIN